MDSALSLLRFISTLSRLYSVSPSCFTSSSQTVSSPWWFPDLILIFFYPFSVIVTPLIFFRLPIAFSLIVILGPIRSVPSVIYRWVSIFPWSAWLWGVGSPFPSLQLRWLFLSLCVVFCALLNSTFQSVLPQIRWLYSLPTWLCWSQP